MAEQEDLPGFSSSRCIIVRSWSTGLQWSSHDVPQIKLGKEATNVRCANLWPLR